MEHIFIINPTAGRGKHVERVEAMAAATAQRHGFVATCHRTTSAEHTTALVRQIASLGSPVRFYACGGDGTLHHVLQGAVGFDNAEITSLPMGTGNDFLRNFGADSVKFSNPENLWDGDTVSLDLIECNGRYCLSIACFGVDARVGRDVHKFSKYPLMRGKGGYLCSAIYNGLQSIGRQWQVVADEQVTQGKYAVVSVCNGRHYGGGFIPIPQAQLDDGVLHAITVRDITTLQFLRLFPHYCAGNHQAIRDYITLFTPTVLELHSQHPDIVVCLDGEAEQSDHAVVKMAQEKVRFFVPKGANPNASAKPIETLAINS